MDVINKPVLLCISGIKNTGKTTCIEAILPKLVEKGLKVAVIKHDGHDFEADVPTTDSYRHKQAGAYGTAIFSKTKYMVVKEQLDITEKQLSRYFPEADLLLMEGFKHSHYPKIEMIRKSIQTQPVCKRETVIAYVSDVIIETNKKIFSYGQYTEIAEFIYTFYKKERITYGNC